VRGRARWARIAAKATPEAGDANRRTGPKSPDHIAASHRPA